MKLHHLGIVVSSIEEASVWWEEVAKFEMVSEITLDPIQDVRVQFFESDGEFRIELIEPVSESSPVSRFLEKDGGGLYHQCFEVEDLDGVLEQWRSAGAFIVKGPEAAAALDMRRIAFLITPDRLMVELLESRSQRAGA